MPQLVQLEKKDKIDGVEPIMVRAFDRFIERVKLVLQSDQSIDDPHRFALVQLRELGLKSRQDDGKNCGRDYNCVDLRVRQLSQQLVGDYQHAQEQKHHNNFIGDGSDSGVICSHDSSEQAFDNQTRYYVAAKLKALGNVADVTIAM